MSDFLLKYRYLLPAFLLSVFVFYSHGNLGIVGLFIPNNSLMVICVALVVCFSLCIIAKSGQLNFYTFYIYFFVFIIFLFGGSFFSGIEDPVGWSMRFLMVFLGVLFVFSLGQIIEGSHQWNNSLLIILVGFLFHTIVGIIQLYPGIIFVGWIPYSIDPNPVGIFQQANLQASMMATAIALSFYVVANSIFDSSSLFKKTLPFVVILLASINLGALGSRVGILGLFISVILVSAARFDFYRKFKIKSFLLFLAVFVGLFLGNMVSDGLFKSYSKFERLSEMGLDVRHHVYKISWDAFLDSPLYGHGIGSFQRVFHDEAAEYLEELDQGPVIGHVQYDHPHNELLLWAIEGGAISLAAFLVLIVLLFYFMYGRGLKHFLLILAVLFPMMVHTQVEHPFYTSYFHYFIFLYLFSYFLYNSDFVKNRLNLSRSMCFSCASFGVLNLVVVSVFCGYSLVYSNKIFNLVYKEGGALEDLRVVARHPFFMDYANMQYLRSNFYNSSVLGQHGAALAYIGWAESYLKSKPDIIVYYDLMKAYKLINDSVNFEKVKAESLYLFPEHPMLSSVNF